jgi:hypothetical protein
MDTQVLFNIAVSTAGFFGGWTLNNIYRSIEKLDKDVRTMPHTYVSKGDYKDDVSEIKGMLTKIFDKLEHKVDKQ